MAKKIKETSEVNDLEYPNSRLERYLAKAAGLVDTKPEYPYDRTERYLDAIIGILDKNGGKIFFGICETAASTSSKVISCSSFTSDDLIEGTAILIYFKNASTSTANNSFNINSTGQKSVYNLTANCFSSNACVLAVFNGTKWYLALPSKSTGTIHGIIRYTDSYSEYTSGAVAASSKAITDLYKITCKYNDKVIHTAEIDFTIPTSTPTIFENREIDTILEYVSIIPNDYNIDTIQGYGALTDTGAVINCQAFVEKLTKKGYYIVNMASGTSSAVSGKMIVKYTLVDGT